jgi:hypothetical protein
MEGQTTQWPKEKGQKDTQRSTKRTHKTKDRVTRTALKTGGVCRCSGRISTSCFTSDIRLIPMLGKNNIARIFAIILINLPPNVNARTITVTLTVADNDIILEFKKIAILLHYLRKFKKKYHYFYIIYRNTRKQYHFW